MIQRHATRNVLNIYDRYASVSEMISILGWPTLESKHNNLRTIMMYKIMNNLVDVLTDTTFESKRNNLRTIMMYKIMNNLVDVLTDTILSFNLQLRGHTEKLQQLAML